MSSNIVPEHQVMMFFHLEIPKGRTFTKILVIHASSLDLIVTSIGLSEDGNIYVMLSVYWICTQILQEGLIRRRSGIRSSRACVIP